MKQPTFDLGALTLENVADLYPKAQQLTTENVKTGMIQEGDSALFLLFDSNGKITDHMLGVVYLIVGQYLYFRPCASRIPSASRRLAITPMGLSAYYVLKEPCTNAPVGIYPSPQGGEGWDFNHRHLNDLR